MESSCFAKIKVTLSVMNCEFASPQNMSVKTLVSVAIFGDGDSYASSESKSSHRNKALAPPDGFRESAPLPHAAIHLRPLHALPGRKGTLGIICLGILAAPCHRYLPWLVAGAGLSFQTSSLSNHLDCSKSMVSCQFSRVGGSAHLRASCHFIPMPPPALHSSGSAQLNLSLPAKANQWRQEPEQPPHQYDILRLEEVTWPLFGGCASACRSSNCAGLAAARGRPGSTSFLVHPSVLKKPSRVLFFFFFCSLGPNLRHMEFPRRGV